MEFKRDFSEDFSTFSELEKCIDFGEKKMFCKYDPCKYLNFINKSQRERYRSSGDIYDFLLSWGMQRVKRSNTDGKDYFIRQISKVKKHIENLERFSLSDFCNQENVKIIEDELRSILDKVDLTGCNSKIVYHTKALHFYLPGLMIPMDRRHTITYLQKTHQLGDTDKELDICISYHKKMAELSTHYQNELVELQTKSYQLMKYPITKLLDHAVIGYVIRHLNNCNR